MNAIDKAIAVIDIQMELLDAHTSLIKDMAELVKIHAELNLGYVDSHMILNVLTKYQTQQKTWLNQLNKLSKGENNETQ